MNDVQRGHSDEAALATTVVDKLRHDVKLEMDQRQQAEEALSQVRALNNTSITRFLTSLGSAVTLLT